MNKHLRSSVLALLLLGGGWQVVDAAGRSAPVATQNTEAVKNTEAVNRLYADLSRAQNAVTLGNMSTARQQLGVALATSRGLGSGYSALSGQVAGVLSHKVITVAEVQGLLGQLGNQQPPSSALLGSVGAAIGSWQLPLRVVLALVALWPLYLFRQALSGGKHWRGLWLGLVLLLLPTLLGGLCALLGGLGAMLGLEPVGVLLAFVQAAWVWLPTLLCMLAGLGVMSYSLWDIAIQFGVVGKPRKVSGLTQITSDSPWELD